VTEKIPDDVQIHAAPSLYCFQPRWNIYTQTPLPNVKEAASRTGTSLQTAGKCIGTGFARSLLIYIVVQSVKA